MKIAFNAKDISALQYDIHGTRVQRLWFNNFDGFGVALGKIDILTHVNEGDSC